MQQVHRRLEDRAAGDGLFGSSQLLASLLLQEDSLPVGGVELGLEVGQVNDGGFGVVSRRVVTGVVPPGSGFRDAGRGAGVRVGDDIAQCVGGAIGGPAAAAYGKVERCQQVGGRPAGQRLPGVSAGGADLGDVVVPGLAAADAAVGEQCLVASSPVLNRTDSRAGAPRLACALLGR
ncbi:MAG: hypothetical protein M3Q87_08300 [Actinomycetota bacterium]|nr:hypothetical protein [Actinomycetota bacterium]